MTTKGQPLQGPQHIALGSRSHTAKHAVVDPEDYPALVERSWRVHSNGYAIDSKTREYMHRVILGLEKGDGWHVDHWDRDPLNNCRSNLRRCTAVENGQNRPQWRRVLGYRGVFRTRNGTWNAYGAIDGVRTRLGTYATEREAALVTAQWRAENMAFSPEAKRKAQGLPLLYMGPFAN